MKAYCQNCTSLRLSSFRPECDVATGEQYEDLCCDACHFVVATVQERDAHHQATEPAEKRKLYECTGCGHLYEERPSSCECMENPANTYNDWVAKPVAPEAKQ